MKLLVNFTSRFKKDLKLAEKQHKNTDELFSVIEKLANREPLEEKYRDHSLKGEYINCRECHIEPDFLLVYQIFEQELILLLVRVGSHSELFK